MNTKSAFDSTLSIEPNKNYQQAINNLSNSCKFLEAVFRLAKETEEKNTDC